MGRCSISTPFRSGNPVARSVGGTIPVGASPCAHTSQRGPTHQVGAALSMLASLIPLLPDIDRVLSLWLGLSPEVPWGCGLMPPPGNSLLTAAVRRATHLIQIRVVDSLTSRVAAMSVRFTSTEQIFSHFLILSAAASFATATRGRCHLGVLSMLVT
jgi:hypothetical protein